MFPAHRLCQWTEEEVEIIHQEVCQQERQVEILGEELTAASLRCSRGDNGRHRRFKRYDTF